MSKWCSECARNKLNDEWQSCDNTCPVIGCNLEELAEKHLKLVMRVRKLKQSAMMVDAIQKIDNSTICRDVVELQLKEINTIIDTLINIDI